MLQRTLPKWFRLRIYNYRCNVIFSQSNKARRLNLSYLTLHFIHLRISSTSWQVDVWPCGLLQTWACQDVRDSFFFSLTWVFIYLLFHYFSTRAYIKRSWVEHLLTCRERTLTSRETRIFTWWRGGHHSDQPNIGKDTEGKFYFNIIWSRIIQRWGSITLERTISQLQHNNVPWKCMVGTTSYSLLRMYLHARCYFVIYNKAK